MSRTTILFVDDDIGVLSAIRAELRREPYDMVFADRPSLALEVLKNRGEEIDIIVTDFDMPEMNGLEFLKEVKELYPHIIRLFLTGHGTVQNAISAINEGEVYRFMTKPWSPRELQRTLQYTIQFSQLQQAGQYDRLEVDRHRVVIESLEEEHPGITNVKRDDTGVFVILEDSVS